MKLLELLPNNAYFKLNGKIYKQKEGLEMDALLVPLIANIC